MAIKKTMTADELVAEARALVKKGVLYGTGMQLDTITTAKVNAKAAQYPAKYNRKDDTIAKYYPKTMKEHLLENADKGIWAADCCGWIKGEAYGRRSTDNSAKSISSLDQTILTMGKNCTDIVHDVKKAVPGMFMWFSNGSHCAIFTGEKNGKYYCVESAPSCDGMKENLVTYQCGGKYWVNFGKLPWVDYTKKTAEKATTAAASSATKSTTTTNSTKASSTTTVTTKSANALGTAVSRGAMNIRDKGSTAGKVIGTIPKSTIVEVLEQLSNGWYKITWPAAKCGYAYTSNADNAHYVYTSYAGINAYNVKVNVGLLNVRKGPGTAYAVSKTVKNGQIFTIVEVSGNKNWGKIQNDGGWIYLPYAKKM